MTTSMQLAVANVRGQARRLVSVLLAITMGVAFVAATLVLSDTFRGAMVRSAAGPIGGARTVVLGGASGWADRAGAKTATIPPELVTQGAAAVPGARVRAVTQGDLMQDLGGRQGYLGVQSIPTLSAETTLVSGRLPARSGELAIGAGIAEARKISVGRQITLVPFGEGTKPVRATVVGVVRPGTDVTATPGNPLAFASDQDIWSWTGRRGYTEAYVDAPGDAATVTRAVAALPSAKGLIVRSAADERAERVDAATQGTTQITAILMVFAVVAVFVAALVIANTFSILVAQRTRQLALLRCIGAERSQVRGSVVVEALLTGLVGSVLGVGLGLGLAALLVRLSRGSAVDLGALSLTPTALLVPIVVGILVTLLAALAPARAATRVAPLAALRPQVEARVRRTTTVRLVLGTLLALGGVALLVLGARQHDLKLGVPGGLVSFVGILAVGPVVVPVLARLVGLLPARLSGVTGELAVENSRRNPARAAATASALLVGVTLITMMSVAGATGTRSADDEMDKRFPTDAVLQSDKGIDAAGLATVTRSSVVAHAARLTSTEAAVTVGGAPVRQDGEPLEAVQGASADAAQATRRPGVFTGLSDGAVLLPAGVGVQDGQQVVVSKGTTRLTLTAAVDEDHASGAVVTDTTMRRLDPQAKGTVWALLKRDLDDTEAAERLADDTTTIPGVQVTSIAAQAAEMKKVMDILLLIVTGLLGVAVLIALVGIGNTLSLSVLERTQESGLLRALGLERRQLRGMLGVEALTLALVGTVLGLALGIGYGVAGVHAALGGIMPVAVEIPWLRLLLVAGIACLAGWLASVIPGRRAAKVSPAQALATD